MGKTLRVVQWATGNIGMRSLRAVIEHPDLELVGLYVYSDAKAGVDAGELCGAGPVGVNATRDIEDILALHPDCVLYMADRPDVPVICRLLESGANVITTRSEFHRAASIDEPDRDQLEAACRAGKSTLHSTGSSPGFITEALPLVLSSLERRIDRITINEYADMSSRDSPEMIFQLLGFGRDPAQFDPTAFEQHTAMSFGPSLAVTADALGVTLEGTTGAASVAVARKSCDIAAGRIEEGTVAALRLEVNQLRDGEPFLTFRSNWYLTRDVDADWDMGESGWRVQLEGDVPLDVSIHFPVPEEDWGAVSPGVTAHRPVNAVPYVCAAEPGIRTSAQLPQIVARLA